MFRSATTSVMPVNQWLSMFEFQQTQPEDSQYIWLSEYGSMTSQLTSAGHNPLQVDMISSSHQVAVKEEHLFLNLGQRSWPYVREVIMCIGDAPWMYGRTVIPSGTLDGRGGRLKLLGEKPLGKLLFDNKGNKRVFIEIAKISKAHHLYPKFLYSELSDDEQYKHLWARRSMFHFQNYPILVQEVFLPDCPLQLP